MSKELNIDLGQTGLTVTANVYLLGVAKATGIACPEVGVTGKYSGDFTATPNVAGVYQVAFFDGASTVSSGGGQIVWDGTAEVIQTGDSFARLGAPAGANIAADIAVIEAQTDDIGIAGAGLTALGDTRIANLDVAVSTRSTLAAGAPMTLTGSYDFAKGTVAMPEAYAANGVEPTPIQALYALHQMLMQFGIISTNITVKKLDGATTAFIVTLDDDTNPTSAERL